MSLVMVSSEVKPEHVADVDEAVAHMFEAIQRVQPRGIRYASVRLPDGVTYIALLELEDGVDNPLPMLPEFSEFQAGLKGWLAHPPAAEPLTVIGSYRIFADHPTGLLT